MSAFVDGPRWVVDGNYTSVGVLDLVWERADQVVWLDLPRWRTVSRVLRRSVGRAVTRQELWNGNRESVRSFLSTDREVNFLLWTWTNHTHVREKYTSRTRESKWSSLDLVRLESPAQLRAWLRRAESR